MVCRQPKCPLPRSCLISKVFQKVKHAKSYYYTYWKHDENQDEGHDVTMTVYEFLVDYVTDDLQIPENAI